MRAAQQLKLKQHIHQQLPLAPAAPRQHQAARVVVVVSAAAPPTPAPAPAAARSASRSRRCLQAVAAVAKDADISTRDWRAQRMNEGVRAFFDRVWTRGEVDLLDELVTDDFAWKDAIWLASHPVVGRKAFKEFVKQMRQAYPDLSYEVGQVGVCDPVHVFVRWQCHGTNLQPTTDEKGRPHKPTFHESHVSGIDFITFTDDRAAMREVVIYREPTLEEREFLEEEALSQDRLAIRLERLQF